MRHPVLAFKWYVVWLLLLLCSYFIDFINDFLVSLMETDEKVRI